MVEQHQTTSPTLDEAPVLDCLIGLTDGRALPDWQILKEGAGPTPTAGTEITVHCTGKLSSGKKFWR